MRWQKPTDSLTTPDIRSQRFNLKNFLLKRPNERQQGQRQCHGARALCESFRLSLAGSFVWKTHVYVSPVIHVIWQKWVVEGVVIMSVVLCPTRTGCPLVRQTCLTLSCLRRGPGGDWDRRRWGKRETIPNATLSPPKWLLHWDGQRGAPFKWFINCEGQSRKTVYTTTTSEEKKNRSGIELRSFCLPA